MLLLRTTGQNTETTFVLLVDKSKKKRKEKKKKKRIKRKKSQASVTNHTKSTINILEIYILSFCTSHFKKTLIIS